MPNKFHRQNFKFGGKSSIQKIAEAFGPKKTKVKKFPDLSGDGKVTKKDVLIGRGVIKRKK